MDARGEAARKKKHMTNEEHTPEERRDCRTRPSVRRSVMGCTVTRCHHKICHTSVTLSNESLIIDNAGWWSTMEDTKFGLLRFFNIACGPDRSAGVAQG